MLPLLHFVPYPRHLTLNEETHFNNTCLAMHANPLLRTCTLVAAGLPDTLATVQTGILYDLTVVCNCI